MMKALNKKAIVLAGIMAVSLGVTAMAENFIHTAKSDANLKTPVSSSLIARGRFKGLSDHNADGEAFIMKTARGYALVLSYGFSVSESQSVVLGFGRNGQYAQQSYIGDLRANSGRQTYILPENLTPVDFDKLYIWSESTGSSIGVAAFN